MVDKVCASGTAIEAKMMSRQVALLVSYCSVLTASLGLISRLSKVSRQAVLEARPGCWKQESRYTGLLRSKFCNENRNEELWTGKTFVDAAKVCTKRIGGAI